MAIVPPLVWESRAVLSGVVRAREALEDGDPRTAAAFLRGIEEELAAMVAELDRLAEAA